MSAAPAFRAGGTDGPAPPRHVAIIMDGNGRWAKKRMLPRFAGHKRGVEAAKAVVRAAGDLGIEVMTLYAFSSENWRRPEDEVNDLMGLLRHFIRIDLDELASEDVQLRVIGDYHALAPDLVTQIDAAITRTANNKKTKLVIALNYGSQAEIIGAVQVLAARAAAGEIDASAIDVAAFEAELSTHDLPPPDLLIRTSGEVRLSNFLLWQAAYAELLFVDTLWPDFGAVDLSKAVAIFHERERRFGGL